MEVKAGPRHPFTVARMTDHNVHIGSSKFGRKNRNPAAENKRLSFQLKDAVLIVQPRGPLRKSDFEAISGILNPWLEANGKLRGLVIHVPKFPGWENISSFIRHMKFINSYHRKIGRVALVADGVLPKMMSHVASHFVSAQIRQFPFDQLKKATAWASETNSELEQ